MGIFSYYDVICHVPRRYEDFSLTRDRYLKDKSRVVLFGRITSSVTSRKFKTVSLTSFSFLSSTGITYKVNAFNREYLEKTFAFNDEVTLVATYSKKDNALNMISIHKGKVSDDLLKPVYSLASNVANYEFIQVVNKALNELNGKIHSFLPFKYINKYRLGDKYSSFVEIHAPHSIEAANRAYRLLKYEEALAYSIKNQLIREANHSYKKDKKSIISFDDAYNDLLKVLPFTLTEDQINAAKEIVSDMNEPYLMYRLLQGDVGSGKTIVSFIALYANYKRGDQGVLMAPTDALARQHYTQAKLLFDRLGVKVGLLVGDMSKSEKDKLLTDIEEGEIDIVIGTHALFSKSVTYFNLGLVVIDEQHRFGVDQRSKLLDKGKSVDLLMMSATPIPRSFALTLFGDLDVSTLYAFPNKKREVVTKVINDKQDYIDRCINHALENSHQVYIVAPLIEYQDSRTSVEELYKLYNDKYPEKVSLLHGKMNISDKNKVLEEFYLNKKPILVSTQVIEVGIDVKTANLMVIYDANNFGLASLHQLRGRVGRDGSKSACLLVSEDENDRLHILEETNDGFKISEMDMSSRGPGDLSGLRQSGFPEFRYLNVKDDINIFVAARNDAKEIIANPSEKGNDFIIKKFTKELETDTDNYIGC